jgi:hypothetical protein
MKAQMTQARAVKALLVVLAACSGKAAEPTPAPAPKPAPAADPWTGSADVPPPKAAPALVVESAGAEPKKALGYALPAYERTFMYRNLSTTNGTPGTSAELTVAWACKAGGLCTYQLTRFDLPGMPPDPAFATIASSTKGEVTVKPDGHTLIQPTTFMSTTPSLVELLKLSIVQLPPQPLGVGAIWHFDDDEAKRTFTLKAITGAGFTVAVDIVYLSEQSTVHAELTFDRGEPLARTLELSQALTKDVGGGTILNLEMQVTIQPPRE